MNKNSIEYQNWLKNLEYRFGDATIARHILRYLESDEAIDLMLYLHKEELILMESYNEARSELNKILRVFRSYASEKEYSELEDKLENGVSLSNELQSTIDQLKEKLQKALDRIVELEDKQSENQD